jgi:hypothetical protein
MAMASKAEREEVKNAENIMLDSKLTVDVEAGAGFVYNNEKARVKLTFNNHS